MLLPKSKSRLGNCKFPSTMEKWFLKKHDSFDEHLHVSPNKTWNQAITSIQQEAQFSSQNVKYWPQEDFRFREGSNSKKEFGWSLRRSHYEYLQLSWLTAFMRFPFIKWRGIMHANKINTVFFLYSLPLNLIGVWILFKSALFPVYVLSEAPISFPKWWSGSLGVVHYRYSSRVAACKLCYGHTCHLCMFKNGLVLTPGKQGGASATYRWKRLGVKCQVKTVQWPLFIFIWKTNADVVYCHVWVQQIELVEFRHMLDTSLLGLDW